MNLTDIINLTKAGYKKRDIDELIKAELTPADPDPEDKKADPDPKPDPDAESGQKDDRQADPDQDDQGINDEIQKQLNDAQAKIAALEEKLKKAQAANINKNIDNGVDEAAARQKRLEDRVRSMM